MNNNTLSDYFNESHYEKPDYYAVPDYCGNCNLPMTKTPYLGVRCTCRESLEAVYDL